MSWASSADQEFCFSALRGIQAGRHFFTFMCPLGAVSTLFRFTDEHAPPDRRAQRSLNKARVPEIANYMVENPDNYVFSAIAASVDLQAIRYDGLEGTSGDVGKLYVRMDSPFLVNDGQHRRAAIAEALKMRPELAEEAISVVLFLDSGMKRSQQMFADLNRHAVRPNKSLNVLYDHRDEMSAMVVRVARAIPLFQLYMDMERTQISNRSRKLFTLNSFVQATSRFLGMSAKARLRDPAEIEPEVLDFWSGVVANVPEWQAILDGHSTCKELRDRSISPSGLALVALGILGSELRQEREGDWMSVLQSLQDVDWSRGNQQWEGVAIHNGRLSKRHEHVEASAGVLLDQVTARGSHVMEASS